MKFIFGPVLSRRLKRSLGIDIVPHKSCCYDCIYCQLGRTKEKIIKRKEFFPLEEIFLELEENIPILSKNVDFVTFSGSGEPTLNINLGKIIKKVKTLTDKPIALLTNGALLFKEDVRDDLLEIDLIIPSLDAPNPSIFRYINRPHEDIDFYEMVNGLANFKKIFKGKFYLEIFLVWGINTLDKDIEDFKMLISYINPDKVQLNTSFRPTAEEYALACPKERMEEICEILKEISQTEIIAPIDYSKIPETKIKIKADEILSLIKRRPCTLDDISSALSLNRNEVIKYLMKFESDGLIKRVIVNDRLFYEIS